MKTIIVLFFLIRPLNITTAVACVFIVYSMIDIHDIILTLYPCIIITCYMAAANILNDFIDIESDQIILEKIDNVLTVLDNFRHVEIDKNMLNTIAELKVPYIIMHMKATPQNMQKDPCYNNITLEIINFFKRKILFSDNSISRMMYSYYTLLFKI